MTTFCDAKSTKSMHGCYELEDHDGRHRGYTPSGAEFFWGDEQTDLSTPVFTPEELGILLVALKPVEHFFPGLADKLKTMKEATR